MARTRMPALELDAFREVWSDGIVDLCLGVLLVWMGAAWIWLPGIAPFAGLLAACLAAPALIARARIVQSRGGYVRWSQARRTRQRRVLSALAGAGVVLFVLAVAVAILADLPGSGPSSVAGLAPATLAWLLALLMVAIGVLALARRAFGYALLLALSGAVAAVVDSNPGWPLLLSGVVVLLVGIALLARFLRHHPVRT